MNFLFFILPIALWDVSGVYGRHTLRFMTWNVGDNKGMNGALDASAVRQVLGLDRFNVTRNNSMPKYFDIYALTLQENCHFCDKHNVKRLANVFLKELNLEERYIFELIGHMATRVSSRCEFISCSTGQHGSTHMLVLAKRGMASLISTFHTNKCMGGWFKNSEKGIAGVKFTLRKTGEKICVGGVHLDSKDPNERRKCFDDFTDDHGSQLRDCKEIFYGGDFNTRTGAKGGDSGNKRLSPGALETLKRQDEMSGSQPYGGKPLIKFIQAHHGRTFVEGPLTFYPTYSLLPAKDCGGHWPCYRGGRPPSWTDRIICGSCSPVTYFSLPIDKSDHCPVVGIYLV